MSIKKTVLITGASKNLGDYLTQHYLKKNFNVIGLTRNSSSYINKETLKCDLSNEFKTLNVLKKIKKKYKNIDLIIACAGASKKTYKISEKIKDWNFALNNNFFCFTNLLDSYLRVYKKKPTKIIIISSIASKKITKAPITYSVAKAALNFYAQIKAKNLAKFNIKINTLIPGNIMMQNNNWSKAYKKNPSKVNKYIKENVPLNKFCRPQQIADICDYLFSSSGDNITGSEFTIDGGETL